MQYPRWRSLRIQVVSFLWEEQNEAECRAHGLTDRIVTEVNTRRPLYFLNKIGRTATHRMIGPDFNDRFWMVALQPTDIRLLETDNRVSGRAHRNGVVQREMSRIMRWH